MKGEINYWYEMANILDAAGWECRSPFVESVLQILQEAYTQETMQFRTLREKVWAGMKEAKWNKKYMSTIEKPVDVLTHGNLKQIVSENAVQNMMASLKSIYEKSNFYKEARIVSFLDHMYEFLLSKFKKSFSILKIMAWFNNIEEILQAIEYARAINSKYEEGFFIQELLNESHPMLDSMRSTQTSMFSNSKLNMKTEKEKFKSHVNELSRLNEGSSDTSFLQFVRPGTAYGASMYETSSTGFSNEDLTRPNTSWNKAKRIKPSSIIKSRSGKAKNKNMLWFDRAEKIHCQVTNTTQVLENIEYMCNMVYRLHSDFIPSLKSCNKKGTNKAILNICKFLASFGWTRKLFPDWYYCNLDEKHRTITQKIDLDFFDYNSFSVFEWFVEGFETQIKKIESQYSELVEDQNTDIKFVNEDNKQDEWKFNKDEDEQANQFDDTAWDIVSVSFNVN